MATKLTNRSFKLLPTANPGSLFIVWTISFPLKEEMKIRGVITHKVVNNLDTWTNQIALPGSAPPSWDQSEHLPPDLKLQSGTPWSRWEWPQRFLDKHRWCRQWCRCQNLSHRHSQFRHLRRRRRVRRKRNLTVIIATWSWRIKNTYHLSPPAEGWGSNGSYQDQEAADLVCHRYRRHRHTRRLFHPYQCPTGNYLSQLDSCPVSPGDHHRHWSAHKVQSSYNTVKTIFCAEMANEVCTCLC